MARKTYKKKRTAKKAAHGRSLYRVKDGWRVGKKHRSRRRRRSWP